LNQLVSSNALFFYAFETLHLLAKVLAGQGGLIKAISNQIFFALCKWAGVVAFFSTLSCHSSVITSSQYTPGSLSPKQWGAGELKKYTALDLDWKRPHPLIISQSGMALDLLGARAVRSAIESLRQGGNAMDAALLGAMTEITLQAGRMISFAGIIGISYYDAKLDKVFYLNGGFNRPKNELEPSTIPTSETVSGRSVLVPGFMAGLASAHRRFGRLPFAALFEPAIYFAEEGFVVDSRLSANFKSEKEKISRLPVGKEIFLKEPTTGTIYSEGDNFRQPLLAKTLRRVAELGVEFFYRGEWGRNLVETVQKEGGKLSQDDLDEYKPQWVEPVTTNYRGTTFYSAGLPGVGGVNLAEALNTIEASKIIEKYGDSNLSADSLFWLIQITRANQFLTYSPDFNPFTGISSVPKDRLTKDHAVALWQKIQQMHGEALDVERHNHSSSFLVIDREGNIAVLEHSINTVFWGGNGIFIDGISIPDSASFQQQQLTRVKPGERLPDPLSPVIGVKNGKPVFASGAIGSALHEATVQSIINVFDLNLDPKQSVDRSMFHGISQRNFKGQEITKGEFCKSVLSDVQEKGQPLDISDDAAPGFWLGARFNQKSRNWEGAVTSRRGIPSEGEPAR
jgi:gamma-glutamyltranspeptidase / glutathione hydrolase